MGHRGRRSEAPYRHAAQSHSMKHRHAVLDTEFLSSIQRNNLRIQRPRRSTLDAAIAHSIGARARHAVPLRLTPSFLTPHFSSWATTRVAPTTSLLHPPSSFLTPPSSPLTPHPSLLTPHPSPLIHKPVRRLPGIGNATAHRHQSRGRLRLWGWVGVAARCWMGWCWC